MKRIYRITGLISGIIDPTDICTGEPSTNTRVCSANILYAPVAFGVGPNIGWEIAYIP